MADPLDPARVRALAERLVAVPSVSPDAAAEAACAAVVRQALPRNVLQGEWRTPDGRPVVWALHRGKSARTVVMLGHLDTVGVSEYASLGAPDGERIAFAPEALRMHLVGLERGVLARGALHTLVDLEQEMREPGTWMFGRGALDMKGGLAAGLAAFAALSDPGADLEGSVLLIACPDEEHESAGMRLACQELLWLREREGLELLGVLNLDYSNEPVAYGGVMGKLLVGIWVLGDPTHVSEPFRGVDAAQLAAEIATRAALRKELVDHWGKRRGVPPVVLRLRDLKPEYNVQTAHEAVIELNLLTIARPLERTLEALRQVVIEAMRDLSRSMAALRAWAERDSLGSAGIIEPSSRVLLYGDLMEAAGRSLEDDPLERGTNATEARDARQATLERLRRLAGQAHLGGPLCVIHLLPPYYPPARPGDGPLMRAARRVLARHRMELRPFYPHVTDASYVAWRTETPEVVRRHLPALGHEYHLPAQAALELNLDVVNLGPWGRDAHGLFERVHAPYAFGTLPGLIVEVVREAVGGTKN